MFRKMLPVVLVLALATIACGFNVSLPINTITPGPLVTDQIECPFAWHHRRGSRARLRCGHIESPPRIHRIGFRHCPIQHP